MAAVGERPNIRIEIQNNLMEPMDVDDEEKPADSDFEDGEISDKNEAAEETKPPVAKPLSNRAWTNTDGGFTTGVDIFDKKEQEKLQERANRFGLKPGEICNFTDEQLQQLHVSLGITIENEKNIRFEAVHMRGTDDMSTEDVFEYFGKYGPACIEWISDESCNVVWQDKVSAARALHFISKAIKGMPIEGPCDPFAKEAAEGDDKNSEKEDSNAGCSILLKNREVQFEKDDTRMSNDEKGENAEESVNISDVSSSIPPGYWRLGMEHPKTKCLLLRFAFKTDKKPLKAERFSDYYKKYGNPNFGGMKGLISESRRKKFKGIFDRNKDISGKPAEDSKNPWGDLAENWDLDEQYAEKLYNPQVVKAIPPVRAVTNYTTKQPEVMKRLGAKRSRESDNESVGSQENVKKKSKVPRMRMYADEEEEKMKRRKQLQAVKLHQNVIVEEASNNMQDLRSIIGTTTKKSDRVLEQWDPLIDTSDLGTKLKNRTRIDNESKHLNQKVEVPRSTRIEEVKIRHNTDRTLITSRHRSPSADGRRARRRRESPAHRRNTRRDYDRSRYKNKLHSDRYERRRRSPDKGFDQHKPKSKVAVVIKTQKRPTVASTIWSRITPKKERLKTACERLQPREESSSSSSENNSSSSSSSSSSESSSSESSSESEEESNEEEAVQEELQQPVMSTVERPGFRSNVQSSLAVSKMKSPLRIEINNDHFKEE